MSVNRRRFLAAAGLPALAFGTIRTEAHRRGRRRPTIAPSASAATASASRPRSTPRCCIRLLDEKAMTPDSYSLGGIVEELEDAVRARARQGARDLHADRHARQPHGGARARRRLEPRHRPGGKPLLPGRRRLRADAQQPDADAAGAGPRNVHRRRGPARAGSDEGRARRLARVGDRRSRRRCGGSRASTSTPAELAKIIAIAKREGIRLHLDGARMFLQAAYTGEDVAEYAKPFDTVYVSLYKYFNAASGAILAGPRDVIDGMYHGRRMFGGGLNTVWPFALVALHYLDGFSDRYSQRRADVGGLDSRRCSGTTRSRSSGSRPARTCSGCRSAARIRRRSRSGSRRAASCCRRRRATRFWSA